MKFNFIISQLNTFNAGKIVNKLRENSYEASISYRPVENAINVNFSIYTLEEPGIIILNPGWIIEEANQKKRYRLDLRKIFPEISPKIYIPGQHFCKFPLILRPNKHRQGKYFYIVNSYEEMFDTITRVKKELNTTLTHGIEVIHPNIEFAVWIGRLPNGDLRSYKMQIKNPVKNDGILRPKNHTLGNSIFQFVKSFEYKDRIRKAAKQAASIIPIDFCRVDILFREEDKKVFVLEINPRFTIASDSTLNAFVKYLKQYEQQYKNNLKE